MARILLNVSGLALAAMEGKHGEPLDLVVGHKIDAAGLETFAADANIVIAHNASFDRKFAERSWDIFQHKHWACPATGID
jgi:hypothetical protein